MRVRLVRRPGQHGTRAYVEQYGEQLVCVRYRYDAAAGRRYKTIEIIVDEAPWQPKERELEELPQPHILDGPAPAALQAPQGMLEEVDAEAQRPSTFSTSQAVPSAKRPASDDTAKYAPNTLVGLRVAWGEIEVARQMRGARAAWREDIQLWQMPYSKALALGFADRIVGTIVELTATRR